MKQWRARVIDSIRKEFGDLGTDKKNKKLEKVLKTNMNDTFKWYQHLLSNGKRKKISVQNDVVTTGQKMPGNTVASN